MPSTKPKVTVYLPPETKEKAIAMAESKGVNMSELFEQLIIDASLEPSEGVTPELGENAPLVELTPAHTEWLRVVANEKGRSPSEQIEVILKQNVVWSVGLHREKAVSSI